MRNFLYKFKNFFQALFVYPVMVTENLTYDQYWQEKKKGHLGQPNSFQKDRGRWIASRVKAGSSIVDVGCGDGSVLFEIKKYKDIRATGLDVSEFILKFLNENGIEAHYLDLSDSKAVESIPVRDHVLLLEVLEHMPHPEQFLLAVLKNVNKSVFISIPNTGYIRHRLRLLLGKFPLQWRTHPSEHLRFWTLSDFYWWLNALGLADRTGTYCYQGIPGLNKIWPSLFAEGIIAEIKCLQERN